MLRERVITALVLLALLIPAVMARSPLPFALLTIVLIAAAGWEWGRLCGLPRAAAVASGVVLGLACVTIAPLGGGVGGVVVPAEAWAGVTVLWVLVGAVSLRAGPDGFRQVSAGLRFVVGWVLIGAAWAALMASWERGLAYLATVCALVWAADIFAYFGGRAFGKRKLAPTISPGKSWEGAISGLLAVIVLAVIVVIVTARPHGNLFWLLRERLGFAGMVGACAALVAMAIMGDLVESLAKRSAGIKDSSQLLPGHGGVLDRIDALLPVFPAALALVTI
ncbi:phosphatidate cytidylyltransferase [Scleromatobacter humisilvae]|uniref:Phosphatidate cytidylyltransferase n=1 Tax=Scleromatobacter humisilvae TaxID=2897159 RepID=A0A9X2BZD8_9BURK|nr:phosphatidate cytidylyltransferase [Scleromatobacter humisilvae]MCK9686568.1 phosphatidate cytidylyltransferase [Scleromatobacter humisilvae]